MENGEGGSKIATHCYQQHPGYEFTQETTRNTNINTLSFMLAMKLTGKSGHFYMILVLTLQCFEWSSCSSVRTTPHSWEEMQTTDLILLNNATTCQSTHQVMILVKSGVSNVEERRSVRYTWKQFAEQVYGVRTLFVLGSSSTSSGMKDLLLENILHKDLLVGFFQDSYFNLTLKSTFALSWARTYCRNKWIFYIDDDSVVNIESLLSFIRENGGTQSNSTEIFCHKLLNKPVYRGNNFKWSVPKEVYPNETYPDYCLGPGYLLPPKTVPLLHQHIMSNDSQPRLWIDDVFITGIVAEKAKIPRTDLPSMKCCGITSYDINNFNQFIQLQEVKPAKKQKEVWDEIVIAWNLPTSKPDEVPPDFETYRKKTFESKYGNLSKQEPLDDYPFRGFFVFASVTCFLLCVLLFRRSFRKLYTKCSSIKSNPKSSLQSSSPKSNIPYQPVNQSLTEGQEV